MVKLNNSYAMVLCSALGLSACSTTVTPTPINKPITQTKPITPPTPDLAQAQKYCDSLKQQLGMQLPAPIQNQLQWQTIISKNPLDNASAAACKIEAHSDGFTLEKQGLTPNFLTNALERLDFATTPVTLQFTADSPTGHQEMLTKEHHLALISYQFAPPENACKQNEPIAACDFPKKKWLYSLSVLII